MSYTRAKIVLGTLLTVLGLGLGLKGCHFPNVFWPLEPTGVEHEIGNSGGEFQQYSGSPYFHEGIDILDDTPAPTGPFVRTTRAGTVTLSLPGASSLYNGLTVDHDDSNNSRYHYWHLDFNSVQQAVRDADTDGTTLPADSRVARLVDWTSCEYHHLHYETCDDDGCEDPIHDLTPRDDNTVPTIQDIYFTENGTNNVFPPSSLPFPPFPALSGQVDIIAKAFDTQFGSARTGVMQIRYRVISTSGTLVKQGKTISFMHIPNDADADILYRNSGPFNSNSNYCETEEYFYVVTNVDDNDATNFDESFAWDTTAHPDGFYIVEVDAWDAAFNMASRVEIVRIDN